MTLSLKIQFQEGTQTGIYVATSRNNSLIGNVITGDDSYVGISLFQSDNNSLLQNTFQIVIMKAFLSGSPVIRPLLAISVMVIWTLA